ncbi:MAG: nickel-dependent lactate racemase [Clostridia bacterium]|nr:nickel-dependent lactate racemase [Clostridia bacterium]
MDTMNKLYRFAYGDGYVDVPLPEKQVLGVLSGNEVAPLADIAEAAADALDHPVDAPALRTLLKPGMRVALIISDMSRYWMRQDLVVPHVLAYLGSCGIDDASVTIVIANGTHDGGPESELRQLVTDAVFDRVRVVNHDCDDPESVYIGTTAHGNRVIINKEVAQADFVIALGACTHHVMAGFGGGRKSILPGVSARSTICYNHAFALDEHQLMSSPKIGNAKLEGNPLHEDMCEAAALVKNLFVINLVMNADMKLADIIAGSPMASWQKACARVDEIYRVPIKEKADIVVASCGGFPKDMSLYQGTKSIDNVEFCLKPGGTLILMIEARDGGGPEEYFGWCRDYVGGTMNRRIRDAFTVPGYIFLLNCEQAQRYNVMMLTRVPKETAAPMGIHAYDDICTLLADVDFAGKSIYVIPNASTTVPGIVENE